ncbi:Zn-dependent hydrolase [Halomarina litorea]|uniref:Zn-dependent hydrolase n=1 Tax=Halomarina litorea TaxID=2961595 RepID=UPI0020C5AA76|nr:Zn-dependent hydrolase [Halomarina sp. BCD28]
MATTVDIDADRFRESFEAYSAIGATDAGGLHRLALTDEDREARDLLAEDLDDLGLTVRVDELGNTFARRPGRDPDAAPVLVGSHLDSQPNGGRFDGQLGVLTALETLRAFEDAGVETDRPVELVNWTNEEGSRFQQAMLGSSVAVGATDLADALAMEDAEGVTVGEALERIGYDGDESPTIDPGDVHAYLELHVEQGPKLESSGDSVGVVDGVFGLSWMEVRVEGQANHAGPTAMHDRQDALVAATTAAGEIHDLPNRLSEDAVATVGRMDVSPNSINVVPDEVTFTVDVRSYDERVVAAAPDAVEFEVATACEREGTTYEFDRLWSIDPLTFSPVVRDAVAAGAEAAGASHRRLVSGAGHDANYMAQVTESGMLFVPSVDGITHAESEFTEWADCVAGAEAFANATLGLATE